MDILDPRTVSADSTAPLAGETKPSAAPLLRAQPMVKFGCTNADAE